MRRPPSRDVRCLFTKKKRKKKLPTQFLSYKGNRLYKNNFIQLIHAKKNVLLTIISYVGLAPTTISFYIKMFMNEK